MSVGKELRYCRAYTLLTSQVPDEYDRGAFMDPEHWDSLYDYDYSYGYGYGYSFNWYGSLYGGSDPGPINCPQKAGGGICCVAQKGYPGDYGSQAGLLEG